MKVTNAFTKWLKQTDSATVRRRLYMSFGSLVTLLVLLLTVAFGSFDRLSDANRANVHSYETLMAIRSLTSSLYYLKRDTRAFAKNPNPKLVSGLQDDQTGLRDDFDHALEITRDNPEQQKRLNDWNALYHHWLIDHFNPLLSKGTGSEPNAEVKSSKELMDAMRDALKEMRDSEARLLAMRTQRAARVQQWTTGFLIAGGLFAITLAITLAALLGRSANELCRTNANLEAAHRELRHAHDGLDRRVRERTAQLEESRQQLRALAAHMESVREEEKTRISREIHDQLGQAMTGLKMDLTWLDKRLPPSDSEDIALDSAPLHHKIGAMMRLIDGTIHLVSQISAELRPSILDDLGLMAAIDWLAADFEERAGITCTFECAVDDPEDAGGEAVATGAFRILQEALTNVIRHANAQHVFIFLGRENSDLVMSVRDDGRGITAAELSDDQSLGLLGMKERAHLLGGAVKLDSTIGHGTTLSLRVPLENGQQLTNKVADRVAYEVAAQ